MTCKYCKKFFAKYHCSAKTHGECDCPKCQGFCKCPPTKEEVLERERFEAMEAASLKRFLSFPGR